MLSVSGFVSFLIASDKTDIALKKITSWYESLLQNEYTIQDAIVVAVFVTTIVATGCSDIIALYFLRFTGGLLLKYKEVKM